MADNMKVIIMAGGKGTRIAPMISGVPKPMVKVAGKPVLEHEIRCLASQEYRDITLVVGYLGNVIRDYFGDGGKFGVSVTYFVEEEPLGTAGALFQMFHQGMLKEDFFLLNCDVMLDIDFGRMEEYHRRKGGYATLFTHPNSHPEDSALIVTDLEGCIIKWMNKEDARTIYKNRVNAGIHILSPRLLQSFPLSGKVDLDREVLKPAVATGSIFAYDSPEYVRDMGTPERYRMVCADYASGKIRARNLIYKQKAVFLDRDGTINRYLGFIKKVSDLELIEGAAKAIAQINQSGYLAIVVTNQPVVARGDCTLEELERIHNQLETLLGREGAWLDDIFYCPHHPDRGFAGERLEYKTDCDCRKPKPGLLLRAARQYNIDLSRSYMVGDSASDMIAGEAAGCRTVYIGNAPMSHNPFAVCNSLSDFVHRYISCGNQEFSQEG